MTKAQQEALKWFKDHGGDGVRIGIGKVHILAAGETAPFMWVTFRTLIALGLIEQYAKWRLRLVSAPSPKQRVDADA